MAARTIKGRKAEVPDLGYAENSQKGKIFRALSMEYIYGRNHRGIDNWRMADAALKYTNRISEIRKAARKHGFDVVCKRVSGSTFGYNLVKVTY